MKDDDEDLIEYLIFDKTMREADKKAGRKTPEPSGCCLLGCLGQMLACSAILAAIVFAVVLVVNYAT